MNSTKIRWVLDSAHYHIDVKQNHFCISCKVSNLDIKFCNNIHWYCVYVLDFFSSFLKHFKMCNNDRWIGSTTSTSSQDTFPWIPDPRAARWKVRNHAPHTPTPFSRKRFWDGPTTGAGRPVFIFVFFISFCFSCLFTTNSKKTYIVSQKITNFNWTFFPKF